MRARVSRVSELFERQPADHSLIGRMIRAARLEPALYAEVQADQGATGQAAAVVLLSALAGGVGSLGAPFQILLGGALAIAGWYLFSYIIFLVGVRLLPEPKTRSNFPALLRAIGFANAPGLVRLAGIVEELRMLVLFVAAVWTLVATVTAVRYALSYASPWRAVGVCAVPLLGQLLIFVAALQVVDNPADLQGMDEPPVVLP